MHSAYVGVDPGARALDSVEVGEAQGIHTGGHRAEGELEMVGESGKVGAEVEIEEARPAEESMDSRDLGF